MLFFFVSFSSEVVSDFGIQMDSPCLSSCIAFLWYCLRTLFRSFIVATISSGIPLAVFDLFAMYISEASCIVFVILLLWSSICMVVGICFYLLLCLRLYVLRNSPVRFGVIFSIVCVQELELLRGFQTKLAYGLIPCRCVFFGS